jgi:DNA-binding response OmpR family regulator
MPAVKGTHILLVEDDYFLATELERYFSALGASVLGPVPSVEKAQDLLQDAEAAILDIRLAETDVFPLADQLLKRRVPFVFYTAHPETILPTRFRHAGYLQKPARPDLVFRALFELGEPRRPDLQNTQQGVTDALPLLRLAARVQIGDEKAADRLVELTLMRAIRGASSKPAGATVEEWLSRLLMDVYEAQGNRLMN